MNTLSRLYLLLVLVFGLLQLHSTSEDIARIHLKNPQSLKIAATLAHR